MKKQYLFFTLFCTSFLSLFSSKENVQPILQIPAGSPVYVTNNYFTNDVSPVLTAGQTAGQTANYAPTHNLASDQNSLLNNNFDAGQTLQHVKKEGQEVVSCLLTWINSNRIATGCITLLTFYSYVSYEIYKMNQAINSSLSWSSWQSNKSLDELFLIPQVTLESELLYEMQNRHLDPANPTDFIYSIVQSSISLRDEIEMLERQITLCELIENCKLSQLFFIDELLLENLKAKQKKLLFIKYIFMSWCTNYKIEQNN